MVVCRDGHYLKKKIHFQMAPVADGHEVWGRVVCTGGETGSDQSPCMRYVAGTGVPG